MSSSLSALSAVITQQTQPSHYPNAVAFCVDNKYLPYALFVAQQLLDLNEKAYDICVCVPDLSQIPSAFLQKNIRFVEMQVMGLDTLPVGKLSLAAYNRLFLPQLFANDYQYIIYLDADTFINRPFYHDLMTVVAGFNPDFCIAAAPDIMEIVRVVEPKQKFLQKKWHYFNAYFTKNHVYRNSGVLVFHVKNCVQQDITNNILTYAFSHIALLEAHDQSAINQFLLDKIAILPFSYNWQMHKLSYPLTQETQPHIIHFIAENKPWSLDTQYTHDYIAIYQDFLNQYFPTLAKPPITKAQLRSQHPKHTNPLREKISLIGQSIRTTLRKPDYANPATKAHVKQVLSEFPFSSQS